MKIVCVVGWYYPESHGGSEVYVAGLARELCRLGHEVLIAAPHDGADERAYAHEGVPVYRYPAGATYRHAEAFGLQAPDSVSTLVRWLRTTRPDLVHFHSWTHGAGYWHARAAREAGFPVYLTFHTASAFCARGTMRRWDRIICDGEIRFIRCAACYFHKRGLPRAVAWTLAGAAKFLPLLGRHLPGRLGTALRYPYSLDLRRRQLEETWRLCESVIGVCRWVCDALARNGCPRTKLLMMRQGCDMPSERPPVRASVRPLRRVGFLGRLDHVKGVMLLTTAVKRLPPSVDFSLELKGIPQDEAYYRTLLEHIGDDPRIHLLKPSPPAEVKEWLADLDLLVVPSRWMETGPLVIYEAFAVGVPVLGARHGGMCELIENHVNGLLFEPDSITDLARILQMVHAQPEILTRLRQGIGRTRSMRDVARETELVYRGQISNAVQAAVPEAPPSKVEPFEVSVIVATFRRREALRALLADLAIQKGVHGEVLVMDQNDPPLGADVFEPWGERLGYLRLRILRRPRGVVAARNDGAALARSQILVFLDDDVRIESSRFLAGYAAAFAREPVDAVCGQERTPPNFEEGAVVTPESSIPFEQVMFFPRNSRWRGEVCALSTCNCAVRAEAWRSAGGLDPRFTGNSYGDDADLALRLRQQGCRILFEPALAVNHTKSPEGGLRLGDRANPWPESEKYISAWLFFWRHVPAAWRPWYFWHGILRKSLFLRANVRRPWRWPAILGGLLVTAVRARRGATLTSELHP
ncbi:MAG: glycosyltransferase [Verrucomicrobiae bacterium]|nr:glycosyltransferase [Verrucomicrobiae bacterium]